MQETEETWVQFLGQEDPLEEGMATHCSSLAWRIPWTEQPGGLQSMGLHQKLDTLWQLNNNMNVITTPISFKFSTVGLPLLTLTSLPPQGQSC